MWPFPFRIALAVLILAPVLPATRAAVLCNEIQQDQSAAPELPSLRILRDHGVDPATVSFEYELGPLAGSNRLQGQVTLLRDGIKLNTIYFEQHRGPDFKITLTGLHSDSARDRFVGKGLGRLHYLMSARILFERTGRTLQSDGFHLISRSARAMWVRLIQDGYAEFIGTESSAYQIQPGVAAGSRELKALSEYFSARIREVKD